MIPQYVYRGPHPVSLVIVENLADYARRLSDDRDRARTAAVVLEQELSALELHLLGVFKLLVADLQAMQAAGMIDADRWPYAHMFITTWSEPAGDFVGLEGFPCGAEEEVPA